MTIPLPLHVVFRLIQSMKQTLFRGSTATANEGRNASANKIPVVVEKVGVEEARLSAEEQGRRALAYLEQQAKADQDTSHADDKHMMQEGEVQEEKGESRGSSCGAVALCGALERTVVLLCCGGLAAAVPHFALVSNKVCPPAVLISSTKLTLPFPPPGMIPCSMQWMGLIGSVAGTFITFILPITFFLRLHGPRQSYFVRAALRALIFVALVAGSWSFYSSLSHFRSSTR
jgi:hypothetical protein